MNKRYQALAARVLSRFGDQLTRVESTCGELTYELSREDLIATAQALRNEDGLQFDTLIDLCGIDYLTWGQAEWQTQDATDTGFSRAAQLEKVLPEVSDTFEPRRFAVVYHLMSVSLNHRIRLRVFTGPDNPPIVPSIVEIWNAANWYEREAFDLFGILFEGHPDLRRILTDYGFIGYPFRKDFPLIGNVEVKYDLTQGRVVYQPVSIEPRTLVPRVIRDDSRYASDAGDEVTDG